MFDIWVPHLHGACMAVLSKVKLLELPTMAAAIDRMGITIIATTTALLNLASTTYPRAFAQSGTCFNGGETANVAALETILTQGPPQQLINAYGPAECCIFCLAHKVTLDNVSVGTVSIGKPIGKTAAHISDEDGTPVPDGEEGELWIGGADVSPGYVDQPGKNKACFIVVEEVENIDRFYRTGDGVRRRIADSQLGYLGCQDHQVQVRGYRIKLEAVEAAMLRTGQFSEAATFKVEAGEGAGSILAAFAVSVSSKPHAILKAAESLKEVLPKYMAPQNELIPQMHLNSHAKVDRKHLSQLHRKRWPNQTTLNAYTHTSTNTGTTQERLAIL
jgi:acyl-coenzyme A synthetase/AMP-(fatty) acid ligase